MTIIPMQLAAFVRNSINPKKFAGKNLSPGDFNKWKDFISNAVDSLSIIIAVTAFHPGEIESIITQVVNLSNIVNSYRFKEFRQLKVHPQARLIGEHYEYTINLFDGLLRKLGVLFPKEAGGVKISDSNLYETMSVLKKGVHQLSVHLGNSAVETKLADIVVSGISKFIHQRQITRNDQHYITEMISVLLSTENLDNKQLSDLLIMYDFNTAEFYNYYTDNWKINLDDIPGLHEQREMLLTEKDRIFDLENKSPLLMPGNRKRLYAELTGFLDRKSTLVRNITKSRRRVIRDGQRSKEGQRFLINLPVPQFGLFLRMQIEKGLLAKESVGELFKFFAAHFYTPNTLYISAESLQKKSTDVEFATAQKLKAHLIGMLNWLNTNYNLSNYN